MNVCVIGTGYVGLVTGTCFSDRGNKVICVDIDENKINKIKDGIIPIYEPGLSEIILKNYRNKNLDFTTDIKYGIENSEIVFITVGTLLDKDGSVDLKYVLNVAKSIGKYINNYKVIVEKSTVPVGTSEKVHQIIEREIIKRRINIKYDLVSNPEFLKEGEAIHDFLYPDRVIIGCCNDKSENFMKKLYLSIVEKEKIITMTIKSAEMTKYASNAMLATKISFMNDISNLCELLDVNVDEVKMGLGSDSRIGNAFLNSGIGYGGSCLPKDVKALIRTAKSNDYDMLVLKAVHEVNYNQKRILINKIVKYFNEVGEILENKRFAVWGLAFKPETDDMRESSSTVIINELLNLGVRIKVYDPKAMNEAKILFSDRIEYGTDKYSVLKNTDALLILTEWKEFKNADLNIMQENLANKIIFDGRNTFTSKQMINEKFNYISMGRENVYNYDNIESELAIAKEK